MSLKPKDLRDAIEYLRTAQLKTDSVLEHYEATAANAPPFIRSRIMYDVEKLRESNKYNRLQNQRQLSTLERILADDEAANWWKGEDRTIEP